MRDFNEKTNERRESVKEEEICIEAALAAKSAAHCSGYDAFMTGYAFACYLSTSEAKEEPLIGALTPKAACVKKFVNSVYLGGKDHPLKISHSRYSRLSINHQSKIKSLRG